MFEYIIFKINICKGEGHGRTCALEPISVELDFASELLYVTLFKCHGKKIRFDRQ